MTGKTYEGGSREQLTADAAGNFGLSQAEYRQHFVNG